MGDKAKEALSGTIPRWATALAMTVCAFFLHRAVAQMDDVATTVKSQASAIAVLQQNADKTSEALGKVDQIVRMLENQLVRLEERSTKGKL